MTEQITEPHDKLVERLGQLMSEISEEAYCAGWMGGTEYFVPEVCRRAARSRRPQRWGRALVTPELALSLYALAEALGHWVRLDDEGKRYEPFDPFPIPLAYRKELNRDAKIGPI